jgi:hypothetical protein
MAEQQAFDFLIASIDYNGYMGMPGYAGTPPNEITIGGTSNNFPSMWQYYPPYDSEKEQLKSELAITKKHLDSLIEIIKYLTKDK